MPNSDHMEILRYGVKNWRKWIEENPDVVPDFSYAPLSGKDLRRAQFFRGDLRGADLRKADLTSAFLFKANLSGASLEKATLVNTFLAEADLSHTNLSDTDFSGAFLRNADLREAELCNAFFYGTYLGEVKFSGIEQFENVVTVYGAHLDLELKRELKNRFPNLFNSIDIEEDDY